MQYCSSIVAVTLRQTHVVCSSLISTDTVRYTFTLAVYNMKLANHPVDILSMCIHTCIKDIMNNINPLFVEP